MKNPFEEASFIAWNNDKLYNKLLSASILWTVTMNNESDLTNDNLNFIFIAENIPFEVMFNYELFKKDGDAIDLEALKQALENWVFSNL